MFIEPVTQKTASLQRSEILGLRNSTLRSYGAQDAISAT